ncbi:MAG: hypothetical protein MJA27_36460 [Pseudanabaenales cyanobacterium]|nr:hypothetical protein [Pseudanabaenales cyanobacterium]
MLTFITRRHKLKWIGIAVGAIALTILLSSITGAIREHASADSANWNDAVYSAPLGLMEQVQRNNLSPDLPIDTGRMRVRKVQQSGQSEPLYLIDSQIADAAKYPQANLLCGELGCAFFGYIPSDSRYEEILNTYFNPHLPPDIPLFESTETLKNGLPVLKVNQMESEQVQQLTLAFNGQAYEVIENQLFPDRYE